MKSETEPRAQRPRILVVEDEAFIAVMLTDMLEELGYEVAASVSQVSRAKEFLADEKVDIALLDVNLGIEKIDPVADLLAQRACPFIFTTGYGRAGIPAAYAGCAVLQKPFHIDDLAAALRKELGSTKR
ncbi:MAG TPA: response regulator [Methylovirgula sp.]|nr:response regulator [Methylovirgula sp.]